MKKVFCLFLCLVFLLAGCAEPSPAHDTSKPRPTAEQTKKIELQLLYNASDSMNPYAAKTAINREIGQLLYEPLVTVDADFLPIRRLAKSVSVNGTSCTVILRSAQFTDQSRVSAQDIVYSFWLAKDSATHYASQLATVLSASARDAETVVFALKYCDPYAANLLDFPILKQNSAKRTNADGVVLPPIGCGRYSVSESGDTLVRNDTYFGTKGTAKTIRLIDAPDNDSISHYVEIGATDVYFTDISDGKIVRMSGERADINLNRLVYIGYNDKNPLLKTAAMRYAISSALSRENICRTCYYNNALPATGLFNPAFQETAAVQNIKIQADLKISVENLAEIGYNNLNKEGYYTSSSGKIPSFTLLVNAENESRVAAAKLIATQLKAAGIQITVVKQNYAAYVKSLKNRAFQLYLGEVQLSTNMDLSELVLPGGKSAYGLHKSNAKAKNEKVHEKPESALADSKKQPAEKETKDMIAEYRKGVYSIADVASALLTDLPVIPICYRMGLLFYDPDALIPNDPSYRDYYRSTATGY